MPDDERMQLTSWFGDLAACLTQDSPALFLKAFHREMAGRSQLEANVYALLKGFAVSSSVEVREITAQGGERAVSADWRMSLRSPVDVAANERRRSLLQFRLRRQKKGWVVIQFDDAAFFAPARKTR